MCRRLRAQGVDTPILMVTARDAVGDRVRGLDTGADDYLVKPFAFDEVLARLRALTRRGRTRSLSAVLTAGPLSLDQEAHQARVAGHAGAAHGDRVPPARVPACAAPAPSCRATSWPSTSGAATTTRARTSPTSTSATCAASSPAAGRRPDPDHSRARATCWLARRGVMRAPLSFRARLTLRWTIAFGLLLACANTAVYMGVRVYAQRDLDAQLRTLAATEIASSTDAGGVLHLHELPIEELGGGDFTDKFVQYYDLDGRVAVRVAGAARASACSTPAQLARARGGDHGVMTVSVAGRPRPRRDGADPGRAHAVRRGRRPVHRSARRAAGAARLGPGRRLGARPRRDGLDRLLARVARARADRSRSPSAPRASPAATSTCGSTRRAATTRSGG